jgi:hypothetical protein
VAAAAAAAAAAAGEEAARYSRLRQYEYLQLKERQLQEEIIVQRDLERHRQQQQQQQQDEAILQQHLQLAQQQQLQQQLQQHLLQQQQPPLPPPSGLNPLVMAIPLSEVEKRAFLDGTLQVPPNMVLRQTTDGTPVLVSTVHEAPPPPPPPQPHYLPHPNHPHPSGGGPRMMADDRIRPEDLDRLLLLQQQQHPHLPQGGGIFSVPSSTASYAVADLPAPHGPPGPHQPPRYVSTASSSMDSPPLPSISISTSHGGGDDRSKESPPPPPPPPQFRAVESTTGSTTTNTTPTTKLHKLKHGLPFFTTKLSNVKKWKMSKKRSLSATFRPSENSVIVFVQHVPPASGADGDDGQVTVEVSSSVALKDIVRNHLKEYIRVPTHLLREQPPPSSSMSSPQDLADMVRRHKHRIIRKVIKTVNILCRSDSDAVDYDHGDGNNNNNSNNGSENVGFCCREDSRWWELSDEASARVVKEMFSVCRKEYIDEKLQKGRTTLKKEKKDREDREIREMIVQQERERAMRGIKTHSLSSSAAATAAAANVVSVVPPPLSPPPDDAEVVVLTEPSQPPPAKKRKISSTSTGTANVGEPKRPNHAGQTKLKRKNKLPTSMRRKLPSIDNSDYYDSTDSGGDDDRNDYGHGDSHDDGPGGGGGSRADHNNGATAGGRGAYKCGLCGKPKVGHICPFRNDQRSNGRDKPQQQQPPPSKVDDDRNLDDVDPAEGWSTYRGGIQVFKQDVYYTAARVADGTRVPGEEQDKEEKPDDDNNEEVVVERRPQEEVGKKLLVETLLVVDDDDDDSETGGRPEVGGGGGGGGSEEDVDDGDSESDDDLVF